MDFSGRTFPYTGEILWLTAEQGGRRTPPSDPDQYATVAFVPPDTVQTGVASFVVRGFDPSAQRSRAEGMWLVADPTDGRVQVGTMIAVCEGARLVAVFIVDGLAP